MDRAAQIVSQNTQENPDIGKAPKSGLKRDNTEQVRRVIPWPHEHIVRHTGKPPSYDSLSLSEFAAGNMRILGQLPGVPSQLIYMTAYFAELLMTFQTQSGLQSALLIALSYKLLKTDI